VNKRPLHSWAVGMAEPLDPGSVQRRAVASAAAVVDRMLGAPNGNGRPHDGGRARADLDRLLDSYVESARALFDAALDAVVPALTSSPDDGLVIGPVAPGGVASVPLFLHVLDGPPAPPAPLHVAPLTRHDGAALAVDVAFDPPVVDTQTPRTRQTVTVTVVVAAAADPGQYHGYVLARGLPEIALALRIDVAG